MPCSSRARRLVACFVLSVAVLATLPTASADVGTRIDAATAEAFTAGLTLRHVGPLGNRVPAVAGVAGDPNVLYAGAASGGIWKSTDGGHQWKPVFDDQEVASIGALAVAPSDPNVVWTGTGEAFLRSNISIGDGVYRSTDAGTSWHHLGLSETGRISRIVVHPEDPDTAWVASLGHAYGPQEERGVFRTRDGGATWDHVLFVDEHTGASDLVIDPNNPRILFAGTWHIHLSTFTRTSGGPGSGLWRSKDGGDTWQRLEGDGLPPAPWGKVALTMSADDSRRVYALIETSSNRDFAPSDPYAGTLWRSDDGGDSWTMVNHDNALHQRPLYYSRMLAMPDDADEVHFMSVDHRVSTDGGVTSKENNSGWDHHDIWIDPADPERIVTGHDGGVSISTDGGEHWYRPQLPIAQMYHVATDDQVPYKVYGNRQDGFAVRGPSNTLSGDTIPVGAWQSVGGCEVGFTVPDPSDPERVWAGCYDGILHLFDGRSGVARDVSVWPEAVESWAGEDLRYRFQWTAPFAISPHDPKTVYYGSQYVHRSTDYGQSWQEISPDLTTDDPALKRRTGGLTLDDAGPTLGPSVFAIAESPLEPGVLWVGTNDGQVQRSRDGGANWTNLTKGLGVPPLGTVSNVEPSRHQAGVVYLTVDRHQEGDPAAYVFRSRDDGATWTRITEGIPPSVTGYAHCVREDPAVPGLLYLGTENAVYVSFDDGDLWHRLRANLPPAPVHWLEVQEHFGDLVIATYGRGIWILDDLSPLRALARGDVVTDAEAGPALLPPRPAIRFRGREGILEQPDVPAAGTNPERGALLHLYLPETVATAPEIEIRDADGTVVRTLDDLPTEAGVHRLVWDLHGEPSTEARLRVPPDENPHIGVGGEGWRELSDGEPLDLLVAPGTYSLRLVLGDDGERESAAEQTLDVQIDPGAGGSEESLAAQRTILEDLWQMADGSARMINGIEWLRKAIDDHQGRWDDQVDAGDRETADIEPLRAALDALDDELRALENRFFDLRLTGASQDTLRWQRRLYARIGHLAWAIGMSDHAPTESQVAVHALLRERYDQAVARYEELREGPVADARKLLVDSEESAFVLPEL